MALPYCWGQVARGRSSINGPRASGFNSWLGLVAQGETVVGKLVHLDRGYHASMRVGQERRFQRIEAMMKKNKTYVPGSFTVDFYRTIKVSGFRNRLGW